MQLDNCSAGPRAPAAHDQPRQLHRLQSLKTTSRSSSRFRTPLPPWPGKSDLLWLVCPWPELQEESLGAAGLCAAGLSAAGLGAAGLGAAGLCAVGSRDPLRDSGRSGGRAHAASASPRTSAASGVRCHTWLRSSWPCWRQACAEPPHLVLGHKEMRRCQKPPPCIEGLNTPAALE